MFGFALGAGVSSLRRHGHSWWSAPCRLLDGKTATLLADVPRGRYRLSGTMVAATDVFTISSGSKRVVGPTGGLDTIPPGSLAWDWSSGRRRLLIETRAATKYGPSSEELGGVGWARVGTTLGTPMLGPDGTGGLAVLVEDTSGATHRIGVSSGYPVAADAGEFWAMRVCIKAGIGSRNLMIRMAGTAMATTYVVVNPSTGAIVSTVGSPGLCRVTAAGGGVWLVEMTMTTYAAGSLLANLYLAAGTSNAYAGDGASSVGIGYFNVEKVSGAADPPSSYVKVTGTTAVDRIADDVRLSSAVLALLGSTGLSLAAKGTRLESGTGGLVAAGQTSGQSNLRRLTWTTGGALRVESIDATATAALAEIPVGTASFGTCARWAADGVAVSAMGTDLARSATGSGLVPATIVTARLGVASPDGAKPSNLLLDELAIWPFSGSDAGLRSRADVWN